MEKFFDKSEYNTLGISLQFFSGIMVLLFEDDLKMNKVKTTTLCSILLQKVVV